MDWIIGGTKDSRDFIKLLSEKNINLKNIILTTVSDYGKKLAEESSVAVKSGAMNKDEMKIFVSQYNIERIFDFSHPYALEVSKNAMETARDTGKKYFRFERKNLENDCISFEKTDELIKYLETLKGNILITLGTNNIHEFKNLKNIENMYFRILPVKISIEKAENAGIKAKNIIGLQGPFSKEFNTAVYKNYEIKYVVTKESGDTGGELEKLQAAYETGVIPIILKRPKIEYPWVTENMEEILKIITETEKQERK